jgi:hypothetical protein
MTHKIRRFIFWFFVLIFLLATTVISLYGAGYRFNLTWPLKFNQLLQKTGTLILDSRPQGATIVLVDKTQERLFGKNTNKIKDNLTTPYKLKNILPGEYEVQFLLDGYWPFTKTVGVYPNEATYFEDAELFRQNLPLKIIDTNLQEIKLTDDKKYLILTDSKKIIDLETEMEAEIKVDGNTVTTKKPDMNIIKSNDIKYIAWVSDNEFMYANDFEIFTFNIDSNSKSLITRISEPITGILWQPSGYLIYSTEKTLNLINLKDWSEYTQLISLEKIMPPVLNNSGDTLYFTAKINNQTGLYKLAIK